MTLTVVVPCFNEADRFDSEVFRTFDAVSVDFLFVDDGSTDGTAALLDDLAGIDRTRFRVLTLDHNVGKAEAVRQGILRAFEDGPDYVGFLDADLSTGLDQIPAMVALLDERPSILGVIGSRVRLLGRRIDRKLGRHYAGRVFATLASMVLRLPVYDTQCGAKFFRATPAVAAVFAEPFLSRWVFDVELLARFVRLSAAEGIDPAEILVEHPLTEWRDVPGSKLRFRHGFRALFDLARIRRRYR